MAVIVGLMGLDFRERFLEVILRVFPCEGFTDFVVQVLKLEYGRLESFQIGEVVWRQDLALQDREEDLNLVEPTGVYRSMNLYGIRVPLGKAFY